MSSIFLEDACALASKIEAELDHLIQPSATDKAVVILYRELLKVRDQLKHAKEAERKRCADIARNYRLKNRSCYCDPFVQKVQCNEGEYIAEAIEKGE